MAEYFSNLYKPLPDKNIILSTEEKEYISLVKQVESGKKNESSFSFDQEILLEVLALLPGKSRGSWDWSQEDRVSFVNKSLEDGYFINYIFGIQKQFISDSYFFVGVVDGSWSLKIFKANDDSYLVLAVDHVGDGNSFSTYTYKNGNLTKNKKEFYDLLPKGIFNSFYTNKDNCRKHYQDNYNALLDYTFNENTIELYDYYAKNNKECFNYDTAILEFNKDLKTFELKETYWKK